VIDPDADRTVVSGPERDGVSGLDGDPAIVSVSDVHGYLDEARRALLGVGEHWQFDPVVERGSDGELHWAGNDYVLVFNGDLVDRGPDNEAVLRTVERLRREAPPGRVRVTMGNHELPMLLPAVLRWPRWYSGQIDAPQRRGLYRAVRDGTVVAAYEGYGYTYAHAGRPEPYDPGEYNDRLLAAAERLLPAVGTPRADREQEAVATDHPELFGTSEGSGRGPGSGICWLDFAHMPADAPAQVVGHTRHDRPTRKGNVVCQNVIRSNLEAAGGEAALVERPGELTAVVRDPDDGVSTVDLRP
jgi:hypothetical protein